MQPSVQQKQSYLRQQILQSNFDPQEFVNFIRKDLQMDEVNMQHISIKNLQQIVFKFKQYKYYKNQMQQDSVANVTPIKKAKIFYDKQEVFDYEFSQICPCIEAESFYKHLEVCIPSFEIKQREGAFFSLGNKTQIWYIIQTNLTQYPVKRSQQHFDWLSCTISRLFPLEAIPQLLTVTKQHEGDRDKRTKQIEAYIKILASREVMKTSNIFFQFLTIPAEKMQKLKKSCESLGFAKGVQSIKNHSGTVVSSINNNLRDYVHNINVYNYKVHPIQESITASIDKVTQLLNTAFLQLNKIVNQFAQMHECYNQLANKFPYEKINQQNQVLVNLNNLFNVLSSSICTTSKIMRENLKQFYKISANYDKSITKLYRSLAEAEKDYVNAKTYLHRKKQRLYPDVSKWQVDQKTLQNRRLTKQEAFSLMLPKQTHQQQDQRLWLGYLYENYRNQFHKYIQFQVNRYVHVFCNFTREILLSNKTYVEELTKFIEESNRLVTC